MSVPQRISRTPTATSCADDTVTSDLHLVEAVVIDAALGAGLRIDTSTRR
jgi:hypothetical protein